MSATMQLVRPQSAAVRPLVARRVLHTHSPRPAALQTSATDLILRVFDLVDAHRLDEMAELLTPDVDFMNPFGQFTGRAAVVANFEPVKVGFPDSRHIFSGVYALGDAVAVEGEWTGTNSGPILTPAGEVTTGKTVRFPFGGICRLQDGKVSAVHIYHDLVIMFRQMGLM